MKYKYENKANCNLTTCRYNADGKCTNEEKRKECVEVARKVLCLDEWNLKEFILVFAKIKIENKTTAREGFQ